MPTRLRVLGHPIHPMLVAFPIGLLGTAVVFDLVGVFVGDREWFRISFWTIAAGLVGGLVAAVFGLADWLSIRSATRAQRIGLVHGLANVIVVLLFAGSWFLRRSAPENPSTGALILSFGGVALMLVTGWLGGELVYRLGCGVDPGAHLNAPSSLSGREASEDQSPNGF